MYQTELNWVTKMSCPLVLSLLLTFLCPSHLFRSPRDWAAGQVLSGADRRARAFIYLPVKPIQPWETGAKPGDRTKGQRSFLLSAIRKQESPAEGRRQIH